MNESILLIDDADPVVVRLTLNRPEKRNALNRQLIGGVRDAVRKFSVQNGRRVILIDGAGPSFCAGLDLTEIGDPQGTAVALMEMYEAVALSPLITIAAVHGAAMGGGAGLVAACDFAVAADDLRLAYPEVRRGLVAALVTCLLRRQIGDGAARQLALLGRELTATEALAKGLVTRVVHSSQLRQQADLLAREACRGAPGAIVRTKRLLDELAARPLSDDLRIALRHHTDARDSTEAIEGAAAFREKREPRWG
jgi:methylglutaconyl-CoA hydratase